MGLCSSQLAVTKTKEQYMMASPLCCAVRDPEASDVVACFGVRRFTPRAKVPLGSGEFYIVAEGDVDVSTVVPSYVKNVHLREFLCNRRHGDLIFGHTEKRTAITASKAAEESHARGKRSKNVLDMVDTTTARAGPEGVLLLKLDQGRLATLRQHNRNIQWNLFDELMGIAIVDQLRPLPLLEGVSDSRVHLFATMCTYISLNRNEEVCKEGAAADALFVLLHGSLSVSTNGHEISVLHAPTYFGEIAVMLNMTRSATVTAKERCLMLEVERRHFRNFASMVPSVESHVMGLARHNLLDKFVASGTPFFTGFSSEELLELEERLEILEVPASEVLFHEGDRGEAFFIIAHGTLLVETQHGPLKLHQGQYFGELALVLDSPRRATVATSTDAVLLSLSRQGFHAFFRTRMGRLSETKIKILQQDASLEHVLDHAPVRNLFRAHLAKEHNDEHLRFWEAVVSYRKRYRKAAGYDEEADIQAELDRAAEGRVREEGSLSSEPRPGGKEAEQAESELFPPNIAAFRTELERIYRQFVDEGSPDEINISQPLRHAAIASLQRSCAPGILDEVMDEVYLVMNRDGFRRFLQSPAYRSYLDKLGVYTEIDADLAASSKALSSAMLRVMSRPRTASGNSPATSPEPEEHKSALSSVSPPPPPPPQLQPESPPAPAAPAKSTAKRPSMVARAARASAAAQRQKEARARKAKQMAAMPQLPEAAAQQREEEKLVQTQLDVL